MAKKTWQYRFGGTDPNIETGASNSLVTGSAFKEQFSKGVEQIGIQALPGTRFKLSTGPDWVVIGTTGIYELDLTGRATITSLAFDAASIDVIKNNSGLSLLVDIVYKGD